MHLLIDEVKQDLQTKRYGLGSFVVDYERSQQDCLIGTLTLDSSLCGGADDVFEETDRKRAGAGNDLTLLFRISEREYRHGLCCFQLNAVVLTFHESEQVQVAEIELFFDYFEIFLVLQTEVGQTDGRLGNQVLLFVVVEDDHEVVETIGLSQLDLGFLEAVQTVQMAQTLNAPHGR